MELHFKFFLFCKMANVGIHVVYFDAFVDDWQFALLIVD